MLYCILGYCCGENLTKWIDGSYDSVAETSIVGCRSDKMPENDGNGARQHCRHPHIVVAVVAETDSIGEKH